MFRIGAAGRPLLTVEGMMETRWHLRGRACGASGVISDQDLVRAVRSETASHDYEEVILATGRQGSSGVARFMGRDPVQQLRREWGQRLIVFPEGHRQDSLS